MLHWMTWAAIGLVAPAALAAAAPAQAPQLNSCHGGTCSWSITRGRALVRQDATGSLYRLSLLGGSAREGSNHIRWNRQPHDLFIFCSRLVGRHRAVCGRARCRRRAISFDHMRELAQRHGQLGWRAYAFPISVDSLEVVASLYIVAQRRTGRPTGWAPWTSLIVGTAASLSANVAVGGHDLIG